MLFGRNFDEIDGATIQAMIDAGAAESVHLDFKRASYGNSDADKKEFLKDVSSFANGLGGHLVLGIDELDGSASALVPLAELDVDKELLRLEGIVRTGIEPTIVGVRMKRIDVGEGSVIVMYVPRSFNPPHRVILRNSNRYFTRNSAGTHELSLEELRMLFGKQRSIEERAKTFVGERFLRIQGNDGTMQLPVAQGVLVMHLLPLPDFGAERRIEIPTIHPHHAHFRPIGSIGLSWRINLDGYCVYRGGETCHGYTQVFRDGSIEATSTSMFPDREGDGRRFFPSERLPTTLIESLTFYMKGLQEIEASPPILLQISAMEVKGVRMGLNPGRAIDDPPAYDRAELHLPSTVISEYRGDEDYTAVIAEQMHFHWNAFNFERCFYFDAENRWIGR